VARDRGPAGDYLRASASDDARYCDSDALADSVVRDRRVDLAVSYVERERD